ncbi:type II toxin-antitoxin system PemK/MazF family toxin [Cellulomonas sp. HZM]|uniref:type II toxin-antitoxin system PemK/MazF family toxin n=1 Tax=Cellulomonas sp. HZM TaxID=1454010 RepID=UPI0009DFEF25|nr:type II toxin-antitoxin system PemK/MazF family toxin [Cellulomonas sp. HZM]
MANLTPTLLRALRRLLQPGARSGAATRSASPPGTVPGTTSGTRASSSDGSVPRPPGRRTTATTTRRRGLPDHVGAIDPRSIEYAPDLDGNADPGEIVWTWVPYEEDASQGKDRPVLVIGRDGDDVLALMLTSKDHSRDDAREARRGRHWLDIGSGPWDTKRRESEVRLDRILRVDPDGIRREGCVVDHDLFDRVVAAVRDLPTR